jgi:hypothetical protein
MSTYNAMKLYQPMNIISFLSFFSPIILATIITSTSIIFQNFKGLIYLGFLIGCSLLRLGFSLLFKVEPGQDDGSVCSAIQYTKYGNNTFSTFVFAFTIMYLSYPMFYHGSVNFVLFIFLIVYALMDIFIKMYNGCLVGLKTQLFLNVLLGAGLAAAMCASMYAGGSEKHLFFNEVSSNKEICYQPKNQTFKCSLYKNGELISEFNN